MAANIKKGIISNEIIFWSLALAILFITGGDHTHPSHYTICPLALLEFSFCPGCGIGRSIGATMHGNFNTAFKLHPLGPVALLILIYRIAFLFMNKIKLHAQNN